MTYESAQSFFGMIGLIMFAVLFTGVLVYATWPGNGKRFEEAGRMPLESEDLNLGGSNGR
jgi:cytochrome c oxidase cbb3-type subunit IV